MIPHVPSVILGTISKKTILKNHLEELGIIFLALSKR